jgi:hypothetical protein
MTLTRRQLQALHARKNQIKREMVERRKVEILTEFNPSNEPFTVKPIKTITQKDLIQMQRASGVRS